MPQLQDLRGMGSAQVLPATEGISPMFDIINQQKQQQFEREQYAQQQQDKKQRDLYNIVGDTLNLKDFNPVLQDKVRKAQQQLANKIKLENPSYGDTYMAAQNMAAELGQLSQSLGRLDQQLALTKKEYELDKRINSGAIEVLARKRILDQLNKTGRIDENVNYFDEALNQHPEFGLVDQSDITFTDFKPEEKQPLKFNVRKKSSVGKTNQYTWDLDNYPAYYNVQQKGEFEAPDISVKSELSGLKDAKQNDIPMLAEDAYKRMSMMPSNVVALNRRIKSKYPGVDLGSREGEVLRRIEAYKEVDRNRPTPRESRVETERVTIINNNASAKNAGGDWVKRATAAVQGGDGQSVQDEFAQLFQGDKNIYESVQLNNGKLKITYKTPKKTGLLGDIIPEEPKVIELDVNDTYLPQKLANVYQTIMGGDVNVERTVYGQTKKAAQREGGTIKGSEVPKGANVTQRDGEFYYQGRKIIQ